MLEIKSDKSKHNEANYNNVCELKLSDSLTAHPHISIRRIEHRGLFTRIKMVYFNVDLFLTHLQIMCAEMKTSMTAS